MLYIYLILICWFCAALHEVKLDGNFVSNEYVDLLEVEDVQYAKFKLAYIKENCKLSGEVDSICFAKGVIVEFDNFKCNVCILKEHQLPFPANNLNLQILMSLLFMGLLFVSVLNNGLSYII